MKRLKSLRHRITAGWKKSSREICQRVEFTLKKGKQEKEESKDQQPLGEDQWDSVHSTKARDEGSCSESENDVEGAQGSEYPISAEDLRLLIETDLPRDHPRFRELPPGVSFLRAHKELREHLVKPLSAKQKAARDRLLNFYESFGPKCDRFTLVKTMIDLDTLLFDGVLKDRICVEWCDHPRNIPQENPKQCTAAYAQSSEGGDATRISIHLDVMNAWFRKPNWPSKAKIFSTPIHEMLHVYLMIKTGQEHSKDYSIRQEICECGRMVYHGPFWRKTLSLVYTTLGAPGLTGDYSGKSSDTCRECLKREEEKQEQQEQQDQDQDQDQEQKTQKEEKKDEAEYVKGKTRGKSKVGQQGKKKGKGKGKSKR